MARLLTAGFETGSINELNGAKYGFGSDVASSSQARTGSYSLNLFGGLILGGTTYVTHVFDYDIPEAYFRFAYRVEPSSSFVFPHLQFRDSDGRTQCTLEWDGPTQTFHLLRSFVSGTDPHGELIASGTIVMRTFIWYVIEGHIDFVNGNFELKINNVTDTGLSITGADLTSDDSTQESFRSISFFGAWGIGTAYVDDIAFNDTLGSFQNSWIGLGGIYLLKPDGEGDTQSWTPSAGSVHWSLVDDVPASTADWVASGTAGSELELYNIEPPPDYVTSIDVVNVIYQVAVAESGVQALQDVMQQGTVTYPGGGTVSVVSISPEWVLYQGTAHYVQPNGSGAWGTVEVGALQVGVQTGVR